MITAGAYNNLTIKRLASVGAYLDDGAEGILMPKKYVPHDAKIGDQVRVFVYFDSEDRLVATTEQPLGVLGDIVKLRVADANEQGAFLHWGLIKDLFVPRSQQKLRMMKNGEYIVKILRDEQTGRLIGTEKIDAHLSNDNLTVSEKEEVDLLVYRRTDIGYVVIINNLHTGVLHFSDIFQDIYEGKKIRGYIRKIYADHKIDVATGKPGYQRVEDETSKILRLLKENGGFLPYHDKSDPEEIYEFFGMSKKTFKMGVGNLYKQRKITLEKSGIKLA